MISNAQQWELQVPIDSAVLDGILTLPNQTTALVIFAHGSGSSRHSRRNQVVARALNAAGMATLLLDLLTAEEEAVDLRTRHLRLDIGLLAARLTQVVDWSRLNASTRDLKVGLFGSSTGAAAALIAATKRPEVIDAVVSRGGRPDLAMASLPESKAPTLLMVGSADTAVIALNEEARRLMPGPVRLDLVPEASHLFEEPGALEKVARLASEWFAEHLELTARH